MKLLFVNANLHGHINPTLGLVKKLTARGHQVSYFCAAPFAAQVQQAGAVWIGYSDEMERFLKAYRPTDRHPFFTLLEYMLLYEEAVLPEALDIIRANAFDMILCDAYFGGGVFLERLADLPVVISHPTFATRHAPVPQPTSRAD